MKAHLEARQADDLKRETLLRGSSPLRQGYEPRWRNSGGTSGQGGESQPSKGKKMSRQVTDVVLPPSPRIQETPMDLQALPIPVVPVGGPLAEEERSHLVAPVYITQCATQETTPWLGTSNSKFACFLEVGGPAYRYTSSIESSGVWTNHIVTLVLEDSGLQHPI
eukprot:1580782-Amphidinium_carterae.5